MSAVSGTPVQPVLLFSCKASLPWRRVSEKYASLWPYSQIFCLHWRGLSRTNTLAYLDTLSVMKESSCIIVTPGVNVEEIVIFITDAPDNYDAVFP